MANLENNYDTKNKTTQDVVQGDENTPSSSPKKRRKWWVTVLWSLVILFFGGILLLLVLINRPSVQNWIAKKALTSLNKDFNIDMKADQVHVDFFGDVTIKNLKVTDKKGLDFIQAKELKARSDWYELVKGLVVDKTNAIHFNAITLDRVDVKVITYKGDSISNFIKYVNSFDNGKKNPNKKPFHLDATIKIKNANVSIVNENSSGDAGKWLTAHDFNLTAHDFNVDGPVVTADIDEFNFVTQRWGKQHIVKQFTGKLKVSKEALDLQKVDLYTDHTRLKGDIKFNLTNGSWQDFTNKVRWEMDIEKGSYFSGYDISYFATKWDNYKKIMFHGKMDGPLNDFTLKNIQLAESEFRLGAKDISFKNLLKGNFTIRTPRLKTDFTYKELKGVFPTFIAVKLKNFADDFGRLQFNGSVKATPKQVYVAQGDLNTGIGKAKINQLYLTDYTTALPKYKGRVVLDKLDASVITKTDQVKKISGAFDVDGRSFDVNSMVLKTNSKVSEIEILDKVYRNIHLDGTLNLKTYTGFIGVNDEKIKAKMNGEIDFKTPRIKADVAGNIERLNLSAFSGSADSQLVSGTIDGTFAMTNLNDLKLDTNVGDIRFSTGGKTYVVPKADVRADLLDGKRTIFVDAPNLINGTINGEFNLADLSDMVKNGLNKILVSKVPMHSFVGQNFDMNFNIEEGLVKLFSPELALPNGAHVAGKYMGDTNDLILNLQAEQLKYLITKEKEIKEADKILAQFNDEYKIKEEDKVEKENLLVDFMSLKINTTREDKQIDAKIDRVEFKDNVFRNVEVLAENNNDDYLDFITRFDYGSPESELDGKLQSFVINLKQFASETGDYVFDFKPTQIQLHDVVWNINSSGTEGYSIVYEKDNGQLLINYLNLTSEDSHILIKNAILKSTKDYQADIEVNNFQVAKIFGMLATGNTMNVQGVANGFAKIKRNKKELKPLIDLKVKDVTIQNREIGTFVVNAKNGELANIYDINAYIESINKGVESNHLNISGTIDNNPLSPVLDVQVEMNDFDIAFTNQFVEGVFSNLRGKTTGVLNMSGPLNDIDYSGDIALKKAGLKLDFVGVDYEFEDTVLNISKGLAQLNNIGISDRRKNSKGTISGVIQFETLASMSVALFLRTENLLLLNTTQKDFDLFWGKVYATGTLFVDGPVKALNLSTPEEDGMKILDNSVFTFNSDSSSNVDEFKMLRFLKENAEGERVVQEEAPSGANMNVDFTANVGKGTTLNVLLGDDIGDIKVRGTSDRFNFKMTREGNISMDGRYDVDYGMFDYKLQFKDVKLSEKQFRIESGSSINWSGNVMAPELDIAANYITSVSNIGEYLNMGSFPSVDVKVKANIGQTLANPSIGFDVEAIDVSSQVNEALASKLNQGEEKESQIFTVLFSDSFNVSESGGLGVDVGALAEASLYNMLFKRASSSFNSIHKDLKLDINYVKGNEAYKIGDRINTGLTYKLSSRLKLKGALGMPITTNEAVNGSNNNFYSKELTVEYDISKKNDRSLVLRGYTKPTNIGMLNTFNNQTYGGGIAWKKNFETIFKKNKKKKSVKKPKNQNIKKDSIVN